MRLLYAAVLLIIGVIVGLMNVANKEATAFLLAAVITGGIFWGIVNLIGIERHFVLKSPLKDFDNVYKEYKQKFPRLL